jgi:hypothetical protein
MPDLDLIWRMQSAQEWGAVWLWIEVGRFRLVTSSHKYGFPVHTGCRRDPGQQRTYRDHLRSGHHCNLQCVRPFDP